jgi:hypothetical protein
VGCGNVEITGTNGQVHSTTLDAISLCHAPNKASAQWRRFWWFDPDAIITVKR